MYSVYTSLIIVFLYHCFISYRITHTTVVIHFSFHFRYLVTEGQISFVYLITLVAMVIIIVAQKSRGQVLDINGRFLFYTFSVTLLLTIGWVAALWSDPILRTKYPGILYVPEPWSFYTLYLTK